MAHLDLPIEVSAQWQNAEAPVGAVGLYLIGYSTGEWDFTYCAIAQFQAQPLRETRRIDGENVSCRLKGLTLLGLESHM